MSGTITPLPNTPSWRGAQLKKAQGQLYLHQYLLYINYMKNNSKGHGYKI
jgi:hypothetical protein